MVERFCPDTNFFLHARAPQELPWSELTKSESDVELLLLDEVLEELDNRKHLGNQRVARRARKLLKQLDPLFKGEMEAVVVRPSGPRVVFRFAPEVPICRENPHGLNLDKADHRILDECLAVAAELGEAITFLTNDRRPFKTAQRLGLPSQLTPDTWLLAEEPDEQGKEIQRLKEEIRQLTQRLPQVDVALLVDGKPVERLEGTVQRFRPHTEQSLDEALGEVIARHPPEHHLMHGSFPTTNDHDWERYLDQRREWAEQVRNVLDGSPRWLTLQRGLFNAELVLHNAGSAPAEGLVVRLEVEGPLRLVNLERHADILRKAKLTLPAAPELPSATSQFMESFRHPQMPSIHAMGRMPAFPMPRGAKDPRLLYWDHGHETLTESISAECEDFRHGMGQFIGPIALFAREPDVDRLEGCLRVIYSARNLPQPVSKTFPIALDVVWMDPQEATYALIMSS